MKQSDCQGSSVVCFKSRREFITTLVAAAAGTSLINPTPAAAIPIDPATAALAVGKFKEMVVALLHGLASASESLANSLESLSWGVYGANFNPVSPSGDAFHVQHAFKWAPVNDSLGNINVDAQGNGLSFGRKSLTRFVSATSDGKEISDVNPCELSFTRFIVQKGKDKFPNLIPVSNRIDFTKVPKDHKEFGEAMIEHRLATELSPATLKDIKNNFNWVYARKMAAQAGSPATYGVCFVHCKSGHQVFWKLGSTQANEKERSDLLAQHIEAVLSEPVV
jgi:hypothetical protein